MMKRPLANIRPLGPFVQQSAGASDSVEELENKLFGLDTDTECKVILEMYGVTGDIRQIVINEANRTFEDIRISEGLPMEIYFTRKRGDYKKIKEFVFLTEQLLANSMQEDTVSYSVITRAVENNDIDMLTDEIDHVASFQAIKQFDAYLKPNEDVLATQNMRPRPSIVFELMYDVPRQADLSEVESSMQEMIDEGMMGNLGEVEIMEDRDSIIAIPLNTAVDVDDYSVVDFNMDGIAQEVASDIMGTEIRQSPELERITVTCTKV